MVDKIIQGKTRTRRQFCSFYTNSDPIVAYMVERLQIREGDVVLEPCAGDGVFIDKIIEMWGNINFSVEAIDLNPLAVSNLNEKFHGCSNIFVRESDILLEPIGSSGLFGKPDKIYTKVIGNPPYGAWQDHSKRKLLKDIYGGYVRETYTLFLRRCLDLMREDGRLVFIIPDTFLALRVHCALRKHLIKNTRIEEILLIPSKFFPKVNFGYSNLCILTLVKEADCRGNMIKIVTVKQSDASIYEIAKGHYDVADGYETIEQDTIAKSEDCSFMIGAQGNATLRSLISNCATKLGDLADCVTGFYSGNNLEFMAVLDNDCKNAQKYKKISMSDVEWNFLQQPNLLKALSGPSAYLPILKGAGTEPFLTKTNWFILWDSKTVDFYKRDSKARFQNSQYYFREGIGIPMVRTSSTKAFLLEKRLFDQSVVGVFPKEEAYLNYLLAFLNSDICGKMLSAINHTANNSANYLKKLPIMINGSALAMINHYMEICFRTKATEKTLQDINSIFNSLYSPYLSEKIVCVSG
jgi:hypothetical protein